MDKSKMPNVSKLKQPTTMLPLPKVKGISSRVLQPLGQNKIQEDVGHQQPARRMLTRRSKSVSDLRLLSKPVEPFFRKPDGASTLSKLKQLTSASTTDLRNKLKKPLVKSGLKTLTESSRVAKQTPAAPTTTRTGLKRTATNTSEENAVIKPKVLKPAKPAPYDYKARFNLLNEKHTDLVQIHKETKQKLGDVEKDLERYEALKVSYSKLDHEHSRLLETHINTVDKLTKCNIDLEQLEKEYQKLQNEHELLKKEDSERRNNISLLETENGRLNCNLTTLNSEHEDLQNNYSTLKDTHEKLFYDYKCLCVKSDNLEKDLTKANDRIDCLQGELSDYKKSLHFLEELRRKTHNEIQDLKGTIRVFCRVRPSQPQENDKMLCNITYVDENTFEIKKSKESVNLISGKASDLKLEFNFDKVFPPEASQVEVFEELALLAQSALDGYHVCVFAYGQTGSGKTYTMQGEAGQRCMGIIPRTVDLIFRAINNLNRTGWSYVVEVSFLEIYNENIKDLLDKNNKEHLDIRFNDGKGTTVTNLTIKKVESSEEVKQLMESANRNRAVAATNFNEHSSRSHAVTKITLTGTNEEMQVCYAGSLSLVDLAGSESAKTSTSERITETKNINKSLSTLGTVLSALHNKESHIPYRNSKLTYLLQSSLGGNSKTLMFVNIAPFEECYGESVNALRFAAKVKEVKITSKKNKTYLQRELSNL
ncbi:hypothetical protein ILUMI_01955 [Ignelater luminosus]|uniref:Kinesin-like protein n=1 Tax=Ignelater luminosus TaxID=2038154 RepID=A0A8K0DEC7_IGNLU|nr:hypothetical protein ILUMI_01955 [Ignelater luminosus]